MKVFATSVQQAADTFLHAGYISAAPQPTDIAGEYPMFFDTAHTGYAVSLDQATRAADGAMAAAATGDAGGSALASLGAALGSLGGGAGPWLTAAAVGAGIVALGVLAVKLLRAPPLVPALARARAGGLGGGLALMALCAACVVPPWQDLEWRDYDDPEAATMVALYGLIREGLLVHQETRGKAGSLAAIQDQIALPVAAPTAGMEYARQAYGLDGWGNEMAFSVEGKSDYTVTSAGPDGAEGTADDLTLTFDGRDPGEGLRTFYLLRREDDSLWVVIRREQDRDANDGLPSGGIPDGDTWDGFEVSVDALQSWEEYWGEGGDERDLDATVAAIEAFYEGFVTAGDPDPVVVQIYDLEMDEF